MIAGYSILFAIFLLAVGGFVDGSLGVALKFPKYWRWEHLWLTFTSIAFVLIPWIIGFLTVKNLPHVLRAANHTDVLLVLLLGIAWGFGAVLYGLALRYAGMALTYAIVMGLTAAVGSLAPLALFHWSEIATTRGQMVIASVLLIVIGVVLCAVAGHLKETALASNEGSAAASTHSATMFGVLLAIASGILSPMINLSFAYGGPLAKLAVESGTSPFLAANVIWAIALSAGGIVNAIFCGTLISRDRSWSTFTHWSRDWVLGMIMGLLGPTSIILYGIGSSQLGDLGPVIGWPIMSSMGILGANMWGAATGEWKHAGGWPILFMCGATTILIVAMFILARVETFQ